MQIIVLFQFNHEDLAAAVTGIEGDVTDLLLPSVGDLVRHRDIAGMPFEGRVTERVFTYQLPAGTAVKGVISVTLCLDRTIIH